MTTKAAFGFRISVPTLLLAISGLATALVAFCPEDAAAQSGSFAPYVVLASDNELTDEDRKKALEGILRRREQDRETQRILDDVNKVMKKVRPVQKDLQNRVEQAASNKAKLERAEHTCSTGIPDDQIVACSHIIEVGDQPADRVAWAYAVRGYAFASKKDFESAVRDYSRSIELAPNEARTYNQRGAVRRDLGHLELAIADFTTAIELAPTDIYAFRARAGVFALQGNDQRALEDYGKAIELTPDEPLGYHERGNLLLRMGRRVAAIMDFNQAVDLSEISIKRELKSAPEFFGVDGNFDSQVFGTSLRDADLTEGEFVRGRWPELARAKRDALFASVVARSLAGMYDELWGSDFHSLISAKDEEARLVGARFFTSLQLYDSALADYSHLITNNPSNVDVLVGLAFCLSEKLWDVGILGEVHSREPVEDEQQFREVALATAEEAVKLAPYRPESYLARGLIRARMSNKSGALEDFDMALALDPSNGAVRITASKILIYIGEFDGAKALLDEIIEASPNNRRALEVRALARLIEPLPGNTVDLSAAISDLDNAIAITPTVGALYLRGHSYWLSTVNVVDDDGRRERLRDAIFDFEAVLRLNQDHAAAKFYLDHIALGNSGQGYSSSFLGGLAYLALRYTRNLSDEEIKQARGDFEQALKNDPNNSFAYLGRGLVDSWFSPPGIRRSREEIYADFDRAIDLDYKNAAAYMARTVWDRVTDNIGMALKDAVDAARYDPRLRPHMVVPLIYNGEVTVATQRLEENPEDVSLRVGRGMAFALLQQYDMAIADLTKAHILQPDNSDILLRRSWVYQEMGNHGRAGIDAIAAEKLASLSPGSDSAANPAAPKPDLHQLLKPGPFGDPELGSENALVTVIGYTSMSSRHGADFQTKIFPELKNKYIDTGRIRFIFRDFPLDEPARAASMLMRCADNSRFFSFVDVLFRLQDLWVKPDDWRPGLLHVAEFAGFTKDAFEDCVGDKQLSEGIHAMKSAGERFGVNFVPSFFVNGELHTGVMSVEQWSEILDPLLAAKTSARQAAEKDKIRQEIEVLQKRIEQLKKLEAQ